MPVVGCRRIGTRRIGTRVVAWLWEVHQTEYPYFYVVETRPGERPEVCRFPSAGPSGRLGSKYLLLGLAFLALVVVSG